MTQKGRRRLERGTSTSMWYTVYRRRRNVNPFGGESAVGMAKTKQTETTRTNTGTVHVLYR
jgi:hypothetical protein